MTQPAFTQKTDYCNGKISHATASGAYDALRRQTNHPGFRRVKNHHLQVYRCSTCTQWHVGNSTHTVNKR